MPETVGTDFLLKANTDTIGGKSDATLNLERSSAELAPTQTTGTQFSRRLVGLKDWSIDFDSLWVRNSSAIDGYSPTVEVNPSTTTPPTLDYISEITLTLERTLVEFANTSNTQYVSRQPSTVAATADIAVDVDAGQFYDTSSPSASSLLVDAWDSSDGKEDVKIILPGSSTDFNATWVVSSVPFDAPSQDASEASFSLESTGTITQNVSSNLDTGLDNLITEIFSSSPSSITALLSTDTSGNIEFQGPVFPESLEITIPVEGAEQGVNISGTLSGAGALTIQETS